MANPTVELIRALRITATRLAAGAARDGGVSYRWSHFGQCNCGNLAQTVTHLTAEQVYRAAIERAGDWGEQAREFCSTSGYPIDFVLTRMFELGLTQDDIRQLERLSDDRVLRRMSVESLAHNKRENVVRYMEAWADLLADALPPLELARLHAREASDLHNAWADQLERSAAE